MKSLGWFLFGVMLAALVIPAFAGEPVACKKIGDFSGRIVYFENYCPVGWQPI